MYVRSRLKELPPMRLRALGATLAGLGIVLTVTSNVAFGISDFSRGFLIGLALVFLAASAVVGMCRLARGSGGEGKSDDGRRAGSVCRCYPSLSAGSDPVGDKLHLNAAIERRCNPQQH